jgi:hypothetical protein
VPVLRLVLIALTCLLAAGVASAAGSAGNYDGAARDIALTAEQAKYTTLTTDSAAAKPPADKRRGFRSGWQIAYLKGTPTKPVAALALIYVYKTTSEEQHARRGRHRHVPQHLRRGRGLGEDHRERASAGSRRTRRRRVRQGDGRRHVALQDRMRHCLERRDL